MACFESFKDHLTGELFSQSFSGTSHHEYVADDLFVLFVRKGVWKQTSSFQVLEKDAKQGRL